MGDGLECHKSGSRFQSNVMNLKASETVKNKKLWNHTNPHPKACRKKKIK